MKQTNFDRMQHFPGDCSCIGNVDHESHTKPGIHPFPDRLYVVTTLFNPLRFRNRYWNHFAFENMVEKAGATLFTAEIAFGDRHFEITNPNNPRHLQLRAKDNQEIWLKENSLNLLIEKLPSDWKYVAWIDADVQFTRPDWAQETMHELQRYSFLQLFSHAQDIGPNYEPLITTPGFVYSKFEEQLEDFENNNNQLQNEYIDSYYGAAQKGKEEKEVKPLWKFYHSGFAWAARRESLDQVGGLIDFCLLGSGDWHQAHGLFGQMNRTLNVGYSDTYKRLCLEWERRAEKYIRRNVGYIPGLMNHFWHGRKGNRRYDDRWRLLVDTKYDPVTDLKKDTQGLYQLDDNGDPRFIAIRDGLRRYAKIRDEDNPNL
jgi:hypothetical protein